MSPAFEQQSRKLKIQTSSGNDAANAGQDKYGASIAFNRIADSSYNNARAAIAIREHTNNFEQCGLSFFTHPTSTGSDDMVEALTLDHLGRLGIGKDPNATLDVQGNIRSVAQAVSSPADFTTSNIQIVGGGVTVQNPTTFNAPVGQSGLFIVTGTAPSWGSYFKFPNGQPVVDTVPAVIPYYIKASDEILCGTPISGFIS